MLELSERMGMTKAELGLRMSARELFQRMALDRVHALEQEEAERKGR